jgi:predicted Zn-dependent peptidase
MIQFEKFQLQNGLQVLVHEDASTPMVAVNILYKVGARDESPEKTGFAHLFEHLMFGGSKHAPNFDEPLQRAGGENNAFTNNDITNYYDILPVENLEVAFWLESDRMKFLNIDNHSLEVQRKVVCEEFKENYLNQPYGDLWHKISALAYTTHPYMWPTIGKELKHVEDATLKDVQDFFNRYYRPNNAIMVVAGNVNKNEIEALANKWFGDIEPFDLGERKYTVEPVQQAERKMEVYADVPVNTILKAYHMGNRNSNNYYVMDLVTDILSNGNSSRLFQRLVKEQQLFSEVEAYVTGTLDEGLIIVEGKLLNGISMQQAEAAIITELEKVQHEAIAENELQKVKNKMEANAVLGEVNLLTRAMNLAYYELLGDANRINTELEQYRNISQQDIIDESKKVFNESNCSTIFYNAKN